MKKLEDIINENRDAFDTEMPSPQVWNSISAKLQKKQSKFSWKPYMAAASIMFFITCTWIIANHQLDINNSKIAETDPTSLPIEVQDAQVQFSSLIEIKRNEINQYKKSNPALVSDFEKQLSELQSNYSTLIPQLHDENKKDVVLQALIENLQMQVAILNQQIEIIRQLKEKNDAKEIVRL